jgi:hypothetical protein
VAEDKLERKVASDRKDYYGDVLAALRGVSTVLILGPGEAKGELGKLIVAKKIRGLAVAAETADKLTEPQLITKVSQHFAIETAGKVKKATVGKNKQATTAKAKAKAKAKAPKKAAKSAPGKRAKNAGK